MSFPAWLTNTVDTAGGLFEDVAGFTSDLGSISDLISGGSNSAPTFSLPQGFGGFGLPTYSGGGNTPTTNSPQVNNAPGAAAVRVLSGIPFIVYIAGAALLIYFILRITK